MKYSNVISEKGGCGGNNLNSTITQNSKRYYVSLYVLVVLLLSYAVQDFFTSANTFVRVGARGGVHVTLIAMIVIFGVYYFFTGIRRIVFSPVKINLWLISLWIALTYILQSNYEWSSAIRFGYSAIWLFVFHFFSYLLRENPDSLPQVRFLMMIMFIFYVFSTVYAMFYIHDHLAKVGEDRMAVVNLSYNVIVFLPWIMMLKRKILRNIFLFIVFIVVLGSMKRGAIIVFPLMISSWIFLRGLVVTKKIGRPIAIILLSVMMFSIGLFIFDQISDGFLSRRFSVEQLADGSGRGQAFEIAFDEIKNWSFVELFLGVGRGFFSHNDWFEFLYCFGLIGVFLYAQLFLALGWELFQLIRKSSHLAPLYSMVVLYMGMVGLFGAIYFVYSTIFIMAFLGVIEGIRFNDERSENRGLLQEVFPFDHGKR